MEETQEQTNNSKPWLFKKGQSGNPGGRPKGSKSLKTYAAEMLASMTDEERQDFLDGLPKEVIWKQAEGNPLNALNHGGEVKLSIEISQEVAAKYDVSHTESDISR